MGPESLAFGVFGDAVRASVGWEGSRSLVGDADVMYFYWDVPAGILILSCWIGIFHWRERYSGRPAGGVVLLWSIRKMTLNMVTRLTLGWTVVPIARATGWWCG
jgi:hypothetical protein